MRIALVVPEFPPFHIGGGGIVFQALADTYRCRHDVRVFTGHDPERRWIGRRRRDDRRPDVLRYPLVPVGRRAPHFRTVVPPAVRCVADLGRDLTGWAPDVAHVHGYGYAFVDIAAYLLRRKGVPYVFTNHGFPTSPASRGPVVRGGYRAYRAVGPERSVRGAAVLTGVSSAALPASDARPGVVVPNGLDPLPASTEAGRRRLRARLGLDPAAPVVAAAGRLSRSKGFDVLVDAASRVRNGLAVVIAGADAGEGADLAARARAAAGAGAQVVLAGPLARPELADLFAMASVVAVPSRDEPFGLVALEAAAMGTRVVATRVGGLPDFLPAELARLVAPDDPDALADAIDAAVAAGGRTSAEAAAAARLADTHSWSAIALRYEELLGQAQAGAGGELALARRWRP